MFHFWGPQVYEIFGGVLELRASIKDGDAEMLDMLVYYFLPIMVQLGKTNYKNLFADHIVLSEWDNPTRRRLYMEQMCMNVETVDGHKVARDEILEMLMGCLKPIMKKHGEYLTTEAAKHAFLAKTVRRMMESSGGGRNKPVRHHVTAKRFNDMTLMLGQFLRSGVADYTSKEEEWSMENHTMHNVAHQQDTVGEARGFENSIMTVQEAILDSEAEVGTTHRVIRGQATSNGSAVLLIESMNICQMCSKDAVGSDNTGSLSCYGCSSLLDELSCANGFKEWD